MQSLSQALTTHRLLVILRTHKPAPLVEISLTLIDAGIRCLEITLDSPGAITAVRELADQTGDRACIGLGTVKSTNDVKLAVDAGARFVVSPTLDPSVVEAANVVGLGSIPGAFTPTEIDTAWRSHPTAVKIFPASVLGLGFIEAVHVPLKEIPLVAVGGITIDTVSAYLTAGATAVAVGRPILGDCLAVDLGKDALKNLRSRAARFVEAAAPTSN